MSDLPGDPQAPHRRQNALTGEWVLVSPQRGQRPWQGRVEERPDGSARPVQDPGCYLCPGNERAGGVRNPEYDSVHVFDNDFPALMRAEAEAEAEAGAGAGAGAAIARARGQGQGRGSDSLDAGALLRARGETGVCRVICFSPRHDLTLAEMGVAAIRRIVDVWAREYGELGSRPDIGWVQIFENKGELMGCSNPHPHGQIWAQRSVPDVPAREAERQRTYFDEHGRSLLGDYLRVELGLEERVVLENDGFVVVVPFWAVWPFETLVISREHRRSLLDLTDRERDQLADVLKRLTVRYDNLFETSFPYSAGIHQAPTNGDAHLAGQPRGSSDENASHPEWHFHMHFNPPLLRSATVRKFMVGYEMMGEPQRDMTPEQAAERLRALDDLHYSARAGG